MDSTEAPFVFRPEIASLLAFSALIALFLPVVAAVWFHRRTSAPPRYLGIGALTFVISQPVLRLTWQAWPSPRR